MAKAKKAAKANKKAAKKADKAKRVAQFIIELKKIRPQLVAASSAVTRIGGKSAPTKKSEKRLKAVSKAVLKVLELIPENK